MKGRNNFMLLKKTAKRPLVYEAYGPIAKIPPYIVIVCAILRLISVFLNVISGARTQPDMTLNS